MLKDFLAVISLSKIENLKAIHNLCRSVKYSCAAVISLSKIENLKAIHNAYLPPIRR